MFQESLEENEKMKSEYTAKLLEATEKYRVILQENEELKERVESLFKLGRGYIDKTEPRQNTPPQQNDVHEIIIESDESEAEKNETENNVLGSLTSTEILSSCRIRSLLAASSTWIMECHQLFLVANN